MDSHILTAEPQPYPWHVTVKNRTTLNKRPNNWLTREATFLLLPLMMAKLMAQPMISDAPRNDPLKYMLLL